MLTLTHEVMSRNPNLQAAIYQLRPDVIHANDDTLDLVFSVKEDGVIFAKLSRTDETVFKTTSKDVELSKELLVTLQEILVTLRATPESWRSVLMDDDSSLKH